MPCYSYRSKRVKGALFENLDRQNDPLWIGKEFFNSINDISFLSTIGYLVEGVSYGDEYKGCLFPDSLEWDEELFEGVRFTYLDDEVVVSKKEFRECLYLACKKYEEFHPDKSFEIKELLLHV